MLRHFHRLAAAKAFACPQRRAGALVRFFCHAGLPEQLADLDGVVVDLAGANTNGLLPAQAADRHPLPYWFCVYFVLYKKTGLAGLELLPAPVADCCVPFRWLISHALHLCDISCEKLHRSVTRLHSYLVVTCH